MEFNIIENNRCRVGVSKITFAKSGAVSITLEASRKYNIGEGDRIMIVQDKNKPDDWYLIKTLNETFPVFRKTSGKTIVAGYSNAVYAMRKCFKLDKSTFSLALGGTIKTESGSAIAMITAPLVQKRKEEAHG